MCPYARAEESGNLTCAPAGDPCMMCVYGNEKRYKEIEQGKFNLQEKPDWRRNFRSRVERQL